MDIVVLLKVVADDQDLQPRADGSLDVSKAKPVVSSFDLNALEAAAQLAAANPDAKLVALTVGTSYLDDSKLKKNILARGADELYCVVDEALADADTLTTARVLGAALGSLPGYDLIVCGDGSADVYAQQVGIQLAHIIDVPVVSAVVRARLENAGAVADRVLETVEETVELSLPAVICTSSDIAIPRICAMKDILAAGKKPVTTWSLADLSLTVEPSIDVARTYVPKPADRKLEVYDASVTGEVEKFIAAVAAELH